LNTTVETSGIADLVSALSGATDDEISASANRVLSSARKLQASLDALAIDSRFESRGPEVAQQAANMQDAIDQLEAAKDSESKKTALIYLKSTVEVSKDFYLECPPARDAIVQFSTEVGNATGKVIAGVAGSAIDVVSTGLNASLDSFLGRWKWPVLIVIFGILVLVLMSQVKAVTHARR
jgi:hypothetical protein